MRHAALTAILLSILTVGLFSCSPSKQRAELQRIEKMIDGNPDADSAMMLLQGISPSALTSEGDRAYYALLLSQAKEKQYETVTDDSLISIAVNYYSLSGDTYHNMLSQYYLGCVKYNAENYPQSIVAMFKALELATELDNKFWMGMACRVLADIYNETYNAAEELIYAEKEYQYMKEGGRQPYINYALLDITRARCNNGEYDMAISLSKQCLDSAKLYKDDYLIFCVNCIKGKTNLIKGSYKDALYSYLSVCNSDYSNIEDSTYLGLAYLGCGNVSEALFILNRIPDGEPLMKNMLEYKISSQNDSFKQALAALEVVDTINNNAFQKRVGMNITSSVVDYFRLSKEVTKVESEKAHALLWLAVIGSFLILLVLAIVVYVAYTYQKKQRETIEQNIEIAQQLKEALMTKEAEYDRARGSMKMMMSTNFKKLDDICRSVFENGESEASRKHISNSVTSIITQVKTDPNIIKMFEDFINLHRSNLISDFKADLPGLPDTYSKLFLFPVLGFSDNTMALFMGKENVTQIYNYRRHLKDKIKHLEETKRKKYLAFL